MSVLLRGGRVLTLDDADTEYGAADVLVAEGVIQAIGPRLDAGGRRWSRRAGTWSCRGW